MFSPNKGQNYIDQEITEDLENEKFINHYFLRVTGKNKTFKSVDFRYTIFDHCYFRGSNFDSCDFTGCKFINTNLYGAKFEGCKFSYTDFNNTLVDEDIINNSCPPFENLKLKFARTLRTNFAQLGNYDGVNKAILVELEATEVHLKKAWKSKEAYYRQKYKDTSTRILMFFKWLWFKILDFIWGNGESALKLIRTVVFILILIAIVVVFKNYDPMNLSSYLQAIIVSPQIFIGINTDCAISNSFLALIHFLRYLMMGLFISILIKRLSRR
jgi:hypothetical protein